MYVCTIHYHKLSKQQITKNGGMINKLKTLVVIQLL